MVGRREGFRCLRDALTWAVRHYSVVFVDLSTVSSIDASALGVLARAQQRAMGLGSALCLAAPSTPVLNALRAWGLDEVVAVVDTVPETRRARRPDTYRWFVHACR